jgi:tRNA pseudouridine55 synthase
MVDGVINLDKPPGLSSAAAVARVKRLLPRGTKIGHAGTLDPFATGVLVLLVGRGTKLCERYMSEPKQYEATVKLGATTETLDPESAEVVTSGCTPPAEARVREALSGFVGEIEQAPPVYSALKLGGKAAYARVRAGETVQLEPRRVIVYAAELTMYDWPLARVRIDCGRGTYIRAIARDLGHALGTSGYLTQLRRTRVGDCHVDQAVTLEELAGAGITPHLRPISLTPT